MKYFVRFLPSFLCLCLLGCTDLDDVNHRLDELENNVSDLNAAIDALQSAYHEGKIVKSVEPLDIGSGGWIITFSDGTEIKLYNGKDGENGKPGKDGQTGESGVDGNDGDAFFKSVVVADGLVTFELVDGTIFVFRMLLDADQPRLLSMGFRAKTNPRILLSDVRCTIIGDSLVECRIPYLMTGKELIPYFSFEGEAVYIKDMEIRSDEIAYDFSTPVKLVVKTKEHEKEYMVYVHAFTGLPVLWIETAGRADIVSRDYYLDAHFKLAEDVVTRAAGDVIELDGHIKGRGNSSWVNSPKKPYRLKFDSKVSFLDEAKDKSWVLLSNYCDKTSLRNATGFYMGSISNLDYTPHFHYVDVMLNGRYHGIYQLGEKLKIAKHRVNVGDDGFLLEIDAKVKTGEISFKTKYLQRPVNIKEPAVVVGDNNYNYIRDYILATEEALYGDDFDDPEKGWQKYMDIDSFVDWYLINEIAKNNDACLYTSCFMNLERGGKLKMGPLWDFDAAFGNVDYNDNFYPEGFWVNSRDWFVRLFQDPAFVEKVKTRFEYFYSRQEDILNDINENVNYIRYSVLENENKWQTLYTYSKFNYNIWGSYENEVVCLKSWIQQRFEWLKKEFDMM